MKLKKVQIKCCRLDEINKKYEFQYRQQQILSIYFLLSAELNHNEKNKNNDAFNIILRYVSWLNLYCNKLQRVFFIFFLSS